MKLPWKDECKQIRMKRGYTQAEFADLLGVSKRTIEQWEAGNRTPTKCTYMGIVLILEEYGSTGVIMTEAPEPEPQPAPEPEPEPQPTTEKGIYEQILAIYGKSLDAAVKQKNTWIYCETIGLIKKTLEEIKDKL